MFETTVVESKVAHSSRTRVMTLPVSVGLHAAVISGAILAGAWNVTMPQASPPQFAAFVTPALPSIPLPVKPEPVKPELTKPEPARTESRASGPVVDAPPTVVPDTIPDLQRGENTDPISGPVRWNFDGTEQAEDSGPGFGNEPVQTGPYEAGVDGVTRPVATRRVEPRYPALLVKIRLKGSATVECIVDETGRVTSATVVDATHVLFGESAREAVLQWRFEPGRLYGDPVSTIFQLTVNFETKR
jgi:protein TonB